MALRTISKKMRFCLARLRSNTSGVALTEFAVVAPVFLTLGLAGFELAQMASTKMKVSQLALSVADNASRLGQTDNNAVSPTVNESDVAAVLFGAEEQGKSIGFKENGRVILSSLERDPDSGRQFIHWQRCFGDKEAESAYGNDTDKNGLDGDELTGMGREFEVTAPPGEAVMFVEVYYDYPAVFSQAYLPEVKFREEAAFIIRDDRDLNSPAAKGLSGALDNEC